MRQLIHLKLAVNRFKCASACIHAHNFKHLIFAVFERRLIQHRMQFFSMCKLFSIHSGLRSVIVAFEKCHCNVNLRLLFHVNESISQMPKFSFLLTCTPYDGIEDGPKSKPIPKIALKHSNDISFIHQIKVSIKHYYIIRWQ